MTTWNTWSAWDYRRRYLTRRFLDAKRGGYYYQSTANALKQHWKEKPIELTRQKDGKFPST